MSDSDEFTDLLHDNYGSDPKEKEIKLFAEDIDDESEKGNDDHDNSFGLEDFVSLEPASPNLKIALDKSESEEVTSVKDHGIEALGTPEISSNHSSVSLGDLNQVTDIGDNGDKVGEDREEEEEEKRKENGDHSVMGITFNDEEEAVYEPVEDAFEKAGRWTFSGGAARKPNRASTEHNGSGAKQCTKINVKNKIAIYSESQRLIREAEVQLPVYKPKQYSSFAEFRRALHGEKIPESPQSRLLTLDGKDNPPVQETPVCVDAAPPDLESAAPEELPNSLPLQKYDIGTPTNEVLEDADTSPPKGRSVNDAEQPQPPLPLSKMTENRPAPRLLAAKDDDIIDLDDDEAPVVPALFTGAQRLLARLSQQAPKSTPLHGAAAVMAKPIEYDIIKKVTEETTGRQSLQLESVSYQPTEKKTEVFTDRRQWKAHRSGLEKIMRIKRLEQYHERMQHYERPVTAGTKKRVEESEDDEDWSEGDEESDDGDKEDDSSSEESSAGEEDTDGDDDETVKTSHVGKRKAFNPLLDDEAEVDGDDDGDDGDLDDSASEDEKGDVQAKAAKKCMESALSPTLDDSADDFTDLPDANRDAKLTFLPPDSRILPNSSGIRNGMEPGDVDLFASYATHNAENSLMPPYWSLLETTNMSKTLSSTRFEPPGGGLDQSNATHSGRSSWNNDTPLSLLYSQKCDESLGSESGNHSTKIPETEDTAQGISQANGDPSQTQILSLAMSDPAEQLDPSQTSTSAACPVKTAVCVQFQSTTSPQNEPMDEKAGCLTSEIVRKPKLLRVYDRGRDLVDYEKDSPMSQVIFEENAYSLKEDDDTLPLAPSNNDTQPLETGVNASSKQNKPGRRIRYLADSDSDGEDQPQKEASCEPPEPEPIVRPKAVVDPLDFLAAVDNEEDDEEERGDDEAMLLYEDGHEEENIGSRDESVDEGAVYSSSEDELEEYLHQSDKTERNKKRKPKFHPGAFIEDEAELSGDEMEKANFADEQGEDGDDDNSDAGSLKNFVDEADADDRDGNLRREVERVHNRLQADEDQRELRYLKEIFFEDGDLYDEEGRARQRRFKWRGLDNDDPFFGNEVDLDDEEDGEAGGGAEADVSGWLSGGAGVMSRWLLRGATGPTVASTNPDGLENKDPAGDDKKRKLKYAVVDAANPTASPPEHSGRRSGELPLASPESAFCSLGRKAIASQRSTNSLVLPCRGPRLLDPCQRTLSAMLIKPSPKVVPSAQLSQMPSTSLDKPSLSSVQITPPPLLLTKCGSFLSRSTALFPGGAPTTASSSGLLSRSDTENHNDSAVAAAPGFDPDDDRPKACVLGLKNKVGLSCFSVKPSAEREETVTTTKSHFSKTTSLLTTAAVQKRLSMDTRKPGSKKPKTGSIFNAYIP